MAKKRRNKIIQIPLSPEKYIKSRCRSLPIGECLINKDWREDGIAQIFIIREHSNENITVGMYLVDIFCLGVKDTFFRFNVSTKEYEDVVNQVSQEMEFDPIDYVLAHNIIYGAIGYAEEYGFLPHKDFTKTTHFILEEDDDNIELMDLEFGHNGKPFLIIHDEDQPFRSYLHTLEETAGVGNFEYILPIGNSSDNFDNEGNDDFILIKYYEDDNLEKKIFHEMKWVVGLSDEERNKNFDEDNILHETVLRMAELSFANYFSKEEKEEAIEFGDNLFDLEFDDFYEQEDITSELTNVDDMEAVANVLDLLANDKPKKAIKYLKYLMVSYPDNPTFLFYMIFALLNDNKGRKADDLAIYAYQKHPDNLKVKTQYMGYLIRCKRYDEFEKIVGSTYSLQDIYPETELFNQGDVLLYFKLIFKYLIETNQLLKARVIFYHLDMLEEQEEEVDIYHEMFISKLTDFFEDKNE